MVWSTLCDCEIKFVYKMWNKSNLQMIVVVSHFFSIYYVNRICQKKNKHLGFFFDQMLCCPWPQKHWILESSTFRGRCAWKGAIDASSFRQHCGRIMTNYIHIRFWIKLQLSKTDNRLVKMWFKFFNYRSIYPLHFLHI